MNSKHAHSYSKVYFVPKKKGETLLQISDINTNKNQKYLCIIENNFSMTSFKSDFSEAISNLTKDYFSGLKSISKISLFYSVSLDYAKNLCLMNF